MPKSWLCTYCGMLISEMGCFAKLTSTRYAHLTCFENDLETRAFEEGKRAHLQEEADRRRAQEDREKAIQEEARAVLLVLRAKGKDLWTREDRRKLVEAKLICVHCGKSLNPGEGAGSEGKHCRPCYMAAQYGEQQAAQQAAKSAASLEAAAKALAGAPEPVKAPEPKSEEPKPYNRPIELE